jgi:hypothetical protein
MPVGATRPTDVTIGDEMSTAHPVAADALEAAFASGNEDLLVEELRKVDSHKSRQEARITLVTRIPEQTASPRVRNAAALALADMRAQSAKDKLIDLLQRADTKGRRGTILYAIEQLDAIVPVSLLIDLVVEDVYEAQEEALNFMKRGQFECDKDQSQLRCKLKAALAFADEERSYTINTALEYLTGDNSHVKTDETM